MTMLRAVQMAFPDHVRTQDDIALDLADAMGFDAHSAERLRRIHAATGVRSRRLALPLDRYARLEDFTEANNIWIDEGLRLSEQAAKAALDEAGIAPEDVDVIMVVSVTGIAAPSLDARLVSRLGLRSDVARIPIFGWGCVGGASGIARMRDLLGGRNRVGLLLSVELCSLTVQRDDTRLSNLIASGLFGDGVAAVVMTADSSNDTPSSGALPEVVDSQARMYPDSEDVLGWDIGQYGFRIVLSSSLSDVVRDHLGEEVDALLARNHLSRDDVSAWIAHTGGPKVIDAVQEALALPSDALRHTRESLAEVGNLSSASVIDVLDRTVHDGTIRAGQYGVLMAMGPGFSSECVLLCWR
jgi:alkylresorcinol/alkylpyrone synthase